MKVYIHIDSNNTYVGNGGLIVLSNTASKLRARMAWGERKNGA